MDTFGYQKWPPTGISQSKISILHTGGNVDCNWSRFEFIHPVVYGRWLLHPPNPLLRSSSLSGQGLFASAPPCGTRMILAHNKMSQSDNAFAKDSNDPQSFPRPSDSPRCNSSICFHKSWHPAVDVLLHGKSPAPAEFRAMAADDYFRRQDDSRLPNRWLYKIHLIPTVGLRLVRRLRSLHNLHKTRAGPVFLCQFQRKTRTLYLRRFHLLASYNPGNYDGVRQTNESTGFEAEQRLFFHAMKFS